MAVAFRSVATTAFATVASGGTVTINKPAGLASGDLMVAHLSSITNLNGLVANWDTPAGWTASSSTTSTGNANSSARLTVFYKIADSSDAAASSFVFTANTRSSMAGGALYAISGPAISTYAAHVNTTSDTTSPSVDASVTPTANSVILFLHTCADASQTTGSVSAQAIATSNPTWTEDYDFTGNISSQRGIMSGAHASRPEATSTGNASCTTVNYQQNQIIALVAIGPTVDVTVSPTVLSVVATVQAPTVTGGATISPTVITFTATVQAPTVSTPAATWTNTAKSSAPTWVNQSKT